MLGLPVGAWLVFLRNLSHYVVFPTAGVVHSAAFIYADRVVLDPLVGTSAAEFVV
jgi:hypothetical protein